MNTGSLLTFSVVLTAIFPDLVHLIVPPKTPVLTGFEPAAIGSYRELVCDASQPDAGTITYKWYKYSTDGNGVEILESNGPIGTSQKYVFRTVTENTSGKYKCRASNSAGTRASDWGDLYVYTTCSSYAVSVTPAKPAIGSTFTLNCYILNPSGFTVNWVKKADALASVRASANRKGCRTPGYPRHSWSSCIPPSFSSPSRTFNLQVNNAQMSDSGYWMCGDIGLSCDSNPIKLIVQAPPGTPQITGFPSVPVTAGTQLNLKCVALPLGDTYDWYKDGRKVTISLSYDFQVTKESAGIYKCEAKNAVGSATSSNKTLVVYYKADSVVVSSGKTSSHAGEKDKFTCTVTGGSPTPTLNIYFKRSSGTPVEVAQGQDWVMAKEDNQAEYYCEAKVTGYPSLDMTSSRKTYNVTFSYTKVFFLNNPPAAVQVGQEKKFTCETDESNPLSYIKWYRYFGSSWRDITTGVTSSERNGAYGGKIRSSEWSVTAAKAMNGAGLRCATHYYFTGHTFTSSAETTVYVTFNPSKITMTQSPTTAIHEGQSITITCETDSANPVADIQFHGKRIGGTWEKLTSGITFEVTAGEHNGRIRKSTLTVTANRSYIMAVFKCEVKEGSFQVEQLTTAVNVYYPPTVRMSSNPTPVKDSDTLTLTCKASGGNPTIFTYKWFYKNKEIPNETSKDYKITNILYTQSGTYRCQAINYSPGGIVGGSLKVDILYKAKWNPELPEVFTVASKINTPMKFVLHVIAKPSPTAVTWFFPNKTAIDNNITFTATTVNDTTYTLSKASVGVKDYGNYTVIVTNAIGIQTFTFVMDKIGPPDPPCCLTLVNATAVSLTLTFTSNFAGGSPQTFTVEKKTSRGNAWDIAVKGIADPGFRINVTQKIAGLDSDTKYEFRMKATNADGDSPYRDILEAKTEATPNVTLTVVRQNNQVTASWPKLFKKYTKIQIKFCPIKGGSCDYHDVADPTRLKSSFSAMEGNLYNYAMIIFDGEDQVFVSAPVVVATPSTRPPMVAIGGGVGGFLFLLVIIAVVLAIVFVLKKRRAKKDRARPLTIEGDATGLTGILQTPDNAQYPIYHVYTNIVNKAFETDGTDVVEPQNRQGGVEGELDKRESYLRDRNEVYVVTEPRNSSVRGDSTDSAEPEKDEPQQNRPEDREERVHEVLYDDTRPVPSATVTAVAQKTIQDLSVEDFKQWLIFKRVTESTYQILAKNGLDQAAIFAMIEREEIKALRIKPLGQEILVRNLVESFQLGAETKRGDGRRSRSGDGEEGAYMEIGNPYEELNITPDVIADQIYTKIKPWKFSRADC